MDSITYNAGEFDSTCTPKTAIAIIVGEGQEQIKNAGADNETKVPTKNLIVFQDAEPTTVRRVNIPHKDDAQENEASWS